jgi:hypothetical protein
MPLQSMLVVLIIFSAVAFAQPGDQRRAPTDLQTKESPVETFTPFVNLTDVRISAQNFRFNASSGEWDYRLGTSLLLENPEFDEFLLEYMGRQVMRQQKAAILEVVLILVINAFLG